MEKDKHLCGTMSDMTRIEYDDDDWWLSIDHGRSFTHIDFCPFCGVRLEKKSEIDEKARIKAHSFW